MIGTPQHEISLVVGDRVVKGWESYEISTDMLTPADSFSLRLPFSRDAWDLCLPDNPIKVLVDDVVILRGFIDERLVPESDESVEIIGRDLVGRLVDESAPGINYAGLGIKELVTQIAAPWFSKVTFSNARNRKVVRGKGKKAKAAGEPVKLGSGRKINGTHIEPGQTRWQVIETLCAQAGYLAWSSADGSELIIGEPNYDQEIQFRFFQPAANSRRTDESTVLGIGVRESVASRYSRIIVVGSSSGTAVNYGKSVASRYAQARDNGKTVDGEGLAFTAPKRLIVTRSVASPKEAQDLAYREMARRNAHGHAITVQCAGHGQVVAGSQPTIFTPDTLASVEDERTGTMGTYLITACAYRSHRDGEQTTMTLVRKGSELTTS